MSLLPQSELQAPDSPPMGAAAEPGDPESAASQDFPGFGDRLSRVWERFRGKPGTFLLLSLTGAVAPSAAIALLFATSAGTVAAGAKIGMADLAGPAAAAAFVVLASLVIQAAMAGAAAFKITYGRSLKVGLAGFFPIALAQALASLILVLPSALVIPGIILALRYALIVPVITAERRGGMEAVVRSRDLVYGRTGRIFIELLLLAVIMAIAGAAAGFLGSLVGGAVFPHSSSAVIGKTAMTLLSGGASAVMQFFLAPVGYIYLQVFYEDCVALKGQDWVMHPRKSRLSWFLAALGAVLIALGVAAAAFASAKLIGFARNAVLAPPPSANAPAQTPVNAPTAPQPEPKKEPTAEERDLARYGDVNTVKLALASYRSDLSSYPATLDELVPKYVSGLPKDPSTGSAYGYVKAGFSYKLSFTLESGIFALAKGPHFLTPEGFDVEPMQSPAPAEGGTNVSSVPAPVPAPAPEPPNPLPSEPPPAVNQPNPAPTNEPEHSIPPPGAKDTDGDGLADVDEIAIGTDPDKPDTDGDGLTDGDEVNIRTNPLKKDSDDDGLDDHAEIYVWQTNPSNPDTDDDGFSDGTEVAGGYDPRFPGVKLGDKDGDGLPDKVETVMGTDPALPDTDGDGLGDGDEAKIFATDPLKADTDGDGFGDLQEIRGGFDPTGPGALSAERRQIFKANADKYGLHAPTPADIAH
ncbi:MAG: hypothetical protein RL272_1212 [Candidatus Parcubacteria bacterium]